MAWKYIMVEATFGDTKTLFPIIFPDKMVHAEIAAVVKLCAPLEAHRPRVVSAGKIEHVDVMDLGGDSETLHLKSREEDAGVIETYSYCHGIVT